MSLMKIALLQIAPAGTLEANLEKGIRCCRKAKESGGGHCAVSGDVEQRI